MKNTDMNSAGLVKNYISTALIRLSREKNIYSISISELCKKAGVSRMSFYRHYSSIDDVIQKELKELFEGYIASVDFRPDINSEQTKKQYVEHYFDYLYSRKDFVEMLIKYGIDACFLDRQTEFIKRICTDQSEIISRVAIAGSIYSVFRLWSIDNYRTDKNLLISSLLPIYNIW